MSQSELARRFTSEIRRMVPPPGFDGVVPSRSTLRGKLWPHQVDAVDKVTAYLSSDAVSGAALVSMPTGTGKTAVVAAAIEANKTMGHYLVLAPWKGIVEQLGRDLDARVWDRLNVSKPAGFPVVAELPASSDIDDLGAMEASTIFTATISKIVHVYKELGRDQDRLHRCFGSFRAVFVDECHYEPAPTWSEAIRFLDLPTVLLTATPYRNDEKYFEIDDAYRYRYQHRQAVQAGFLRTPRFDLIENSANSFIEGVLAVVDSLPSPDSRVIIRCTDADAIRDCVAEVEANGRTAVGVHETFPAGGNGPLLTKVPSTDACSAQFWVHQFKLIEGIDDPRFRVLAFRDRLGNDRATVQQIGRVLRNPTQDPGDSTAWVLSQEGFDVERVWNNYQEFDRTTGESVATTPELAHQLLAVQPGSVYYDGRFRSPIDLDDPRAWQSFAYPLAARVYRLSRAGAESLTELASEVSSEWRKEDRDVGTVQRPDRQTVVIPYIAIGNSDFLLSGAFIAADFGFTVIRMTDRRLFVFDTQGRTPKCISDRFAKETRASLARLLPAQSRLTTVSLDNTDVSRRAIRARTIRAAAVEDLAPDLSDYTYVCSVAEGYPHVGATDRNPVRRYLGISRSRIRDRTANDRTFDAFSSWLSDVEAVLDDHQVKPTEAFSRYATAVETPADPTPRHLLIDVDQSQFERESDDGVFEALVLEEYASAVTNEVASMRVNGTNLDIRVTWDGLHGRYEVDCEPLKRLAFNLDPPMGRAGMS